MTDEATTKVHPHHVFTQDFSPVETWPDDFEVTHKPDDHATPLVINDGSDQWTVIRYNRSSHPCDTWPECVSVTIAAGDFDALRRALDDQCVPAIMTALADDTELSDEVTTHLNECRGCDVALHHFGVRTTHNAISTTQRSVPQRVLAVAG